MTRVLAEGTIRYLAQQVDSPYSDWAVSRVFVLDYEPGFSDNPYVTVVARDWMWLPNHKVASPPGSVHYLAAYDEDEGDLLKVDMSELVGV